MTFKKLVELIAETTVGYDRALKWEEISHIEGEIEKSFNADKITWKDHETLYTLLGAICR